MKGIDLKKAAEVLRGQGFDVVIGDGELSGRRDDVSGVWTLYMDRAGRIRVVASMPGDIPRGRRVKTGGRVFRVLREVQKTTTVLTEISSLEELPEALAGVGQVLASEEQQEHENVG